MKLAVYGIMKNEAKNIEAFYLSRPEARDDGIARLSLDILEQEAQSAESGG